MKPMEIWLTGALMVACGVYLFDPSKAGAGMFMLGSGFGLFIAVILMRIPLHEQP